MVYEAGSTGSPVPTSPDHVSFLAYEALREAFAVGEFSRAPFNQIRSELRDEGLKRQLADQETQLRMTVAIDSGLRSLDELSKEMAESRKARDQLTTDVREAAGQSLDLPQALRQDAEDERRPDSDRQIFDELAEKLGIIAGGLSAADGILSSAKQAADDEAAPEMGEGD